MLALISPSKDIKIRPKLTPELPTQPIMFNDTKTLVTLMREQTRLDVQHMMRISPELAELTVNRFRKFDFENIEPVAHPALFTFFGDVYRHLDPDTLSIEELKTAQSKLRILSGLYGILKPNDLVQPYRLEMGRKLKTDAGRSLYDFWSDKLSMSLNDELKSHKNQTVINLASIEYFKAVNTKTLKYPIVHVKFLNKTKNGYGVVGFHAKRARGLMARWIIKQNVSSPEDLKRFSENDYLFAPHLSNPELLVFAAP